MAKISWRKAALPVLGVGLLGAGAVSFTGGAQTSAHDRGDWNKGTQYSLKLEGVQGEGKDGAINLDAYRIMEDEPDVQQLAENKTALSDLGDNNMRIIAPASKASPELFEKAASGETIANATLTVKKPGKTNAYLTLKMTDVMVSNYQNSGNDENDSVDEVVFDYATLTVEHNEGTPVRAGWDFKGKAKIEQ